MSLLEITGLRGGYGDADILHGVDIAVESGETVTLAGTNGAGKSTVVKAVMGLLPRVLGTIRFDGTDLGEAAPEDRIGLGIGYVPQVANVFPTLTVTENLQVVEAVRDRRRRTEEILALFPALAERRKRRANTLSGGERQQLAVARALMTEPKLLLLDEPTAALAPAVVAQVLDLIRELRGLGVAMLVVEQRARMSLEVSDRGYVMDDGRVVLAGPARNLLADVEMGELFLGRTGESASRDARGDGA